MTKEKTSGKKRALNPFREFEIRMMTAMIIARIAPVVTDLREWYQDFCEGNHREPTEAELRRRIDNLMEYYRVFE